MERDDIRRTLHRIFEEETDNKVDALTDATNLAAQYDLDSVDMVSLIMHVEGRFRVRLTHDELVGATTVGALIDLIRAKLPRPAAQCA